MRDAERWWALGVGAIGLAGFVAGSLLARVPLPDAGDDDLAVALERDRGRILSGSVLAVLGSALLLLPLAVVSAAPREAAADGSGDGWSALGLFALATWVLGFGFLALSAVATSAVVWRDPAELSSSTRRLLLDAAHLATWSISAPVGAVSTVATTVVAIQAGLAGPLLAGAAAAKVLTVGVELAGTGARTGWNVGGWARGASGYATVTWFALLLIALS